MTSIFRTLKIIIIQLIIIFSIFLILMSFPKPRHYFLSGIYKVPEFYYKNLLKTDLNQRNFVSISNKLNRYFKFVNYIKIEKSRLSPGYIDILVDAYNRTLLDSEKILFNDLMNKSLQLDPENIYVLTSIIEINSIVKPALNFDLKYYEKAIKINPSFKKIYIIGIKEAIELADQNKIDNFCARYFDAILGEAKDYNYNHFLGKGNNKIALYVSENIDKEQIYLNEGLITGNNVVTFNLLNLKKINKFSIIFPNNSNLSFRLNKLNILSNNSVITSYNSNDLLILSSNGLINNNKIYNISHKTNKLIIFLPKQINSTINQIKLDFDIEKNLFFNQNICKNILNE